MKKLALLALLGGGGYLLYRYYGDIVQAMGITDPSDDEGDSGGLGGVFTGAFQTVAALGVALGDLDFINENSDMNISTMYLNLLKQMENSLKKGWDASKQKWFVHLDSQGLPTIAYGHLVKAGENFNNGLSEAEAMALLINDITEHAGYVKRNIKPKLTQNQFDALVDFVYNAGAGSLLGTSKFTKKYGLDPMKKFNSQGIKAGFDEIKRHYQILATLPAYAPSARGLLNRNAMQLNMALNGIYKAA